MSLQVEKLEKNMAKLTVEVSAEQFEECIKAAYKKNKNRFMIPGFRKGKAPQHMIEKMYGPGVFYEDAAEEAIDQTYADAMKDSELEIVSRPEISIVQIEKGQAFIYNAMVAVKPEVTLGEYKGIQVEKASEEVTDEDVAAELVRIQNQNSRLITIEDRPVEDGDQAVIDFDGSVDGVAFDGGKAEDYPLTIGSHSFIDTFEEQLIGKNIGEECEVNVTFPSEYHAKELAGKPAVFKVTVKEIKEKELPELNDEFAEEVSDFDTLDEYKGDIRAKLLETRQKQAATENENRVVEKAVADGLGMDIDVKNSQGVLVVNVGFETTEISILSLGGIVLSRLIKTGGLKFDEAIRAAVRKEFSLIIGGKTSEMIKTSLKELEGEGKGAIVYGRDIVTGLPIEREIPTKLVVECLEEHFNTIVDNVKVILETDPAGACGRHLPSWHLSHRRSVPDQPSGGSYRGRNGIAC